MFSFRKFVQYVHNDGCGCHKVPRLPFNTVNVSCMQTEGVGLCTKPGLLLQYLADLPSTCQLKSSICFHIEYIY